MEREEIKKIVREVLEEERKKGNADVTGELSNDEIYNELIMPVDTNIRLSSVILSDVNKDRIRDFVLEMKNHEKLAKFGFSVKKKKK